MSLFLLFSVCGSVQARTVALPYFSSQVVDFFFFSFHIFDYTTIKMKGASSDFSFGLGTFPNSRA